ncbi:MAG TPA: hypothetical protein VME23_20505 [Terracidiphilus sp.]|nr:hypothetical protein [Terracidiphilus sp.]
MSRYNLPMPRRAAQLLEEARQLPTAEQVWLIDSLMGEQGAMSDEAFAAWQKEVGESEPGYDEWFRRGIEEALADDSPGTPHEEVMQDIARILRSSRTVQRLKQSA